MGVRHRYKMTECGEIPEDWEILQLKDGLNESPSYGINAAASTYQEGYYPYIRITDINNDGKFCPEEKVYVNARGLSKFFLNEGDILFARTGASVGKSYLYKTKDGKLVYAGYLIKIHPDYHIFLPSFIFYYTHSYKYYSWVSKVSLRSGKPGINGKEYGSLVLPKPPINEQKAIAKVLSNIDNLIDNINILIKKKQNIKNATMRELLTGRTRLHNFHDKWNELYFNDYIIFLKNKTYSRSQLTSLGNIHYLHYGDIHKSNKTIVSPLDFPFIIDLGCDQYDFLQDGDLVFVDASEDLEGVGKSVEICNVNNEKFIAGLHTIEVRFSKKFFADGFKRYLQYIPSFSNYLKKLASGLKVYSTQKNHISESKIKIPSLEEQKAIADILSNMDSEIEALEERKSKLESIKHGMMQSLLTGKIRLPFKDDSDDGETNRT